MFSWSKSVIENTLIGQLQKKDGKMAQQVKTLAIKPYALNSIPLPQAQPGKKREPTSDSCSVISTQTHL